MQCHLPERFARIGWGKRAVLPIAIHAFMLFLIEFFWLFAYMAF